MLFIIRINVTIWVYINNRGIIKSILFIGGFYNGFELLQQKCLKELMKVAMQLVHSM